MLEEGGTIIPLFYVHTSPEVLAIPEPVTMSSIGRNIEPHSTKIILVSIPSLEEGVGAAGRRAVITLMISGTSLQSRVISSGETLTYSTAIYEENTRQQHQKGIIFVKIDEENPRDLRILDIIRKLNTPDFEVVGISVNNDSQGIAQEQQRPTVLVEAGVILRIPVREIARRFNSIFLTSSSVVAPSVATFTNFSTSSGVTSFVTLSEQSYSFLESPQQPRMATRLETVVLQTEEVWQQPIKMTSTGWTVFGILWAGLGLTFLISVGIAYGWYIAQYL